MILSVVSLAVYVAPLPTIRSEISNDYTALSNVSLECKYIDNGEPCAAHVFSNFEFYKKLLYPREVPFTPNEYFEAGMRKAITLVQGVIQTSQEKYDPRSIDEHYTLSVTEDIITIKSTNSFGFARALASLIQLVNYHPDQPEVGQAYSIHLAEIEDRPAYPWRQLMFDAVRHYLSIRNIKREIDAMSIAKFNILHLHATDAEAFPLKFENAPQKDLVKGAWAEPFYYSMADLEDLQQYALERGVYVYLEVDIPGHSYSWHNAREDLVPVCPDTVVVNPNNVALNPMNEVVYEYVHGVVKETLTSGLFSEVNSHITKRAMHLGGDEISSKCFKEDPNTSKYLTDNDLTTNDIWRQFHQRVFDNIQQEFHDTETAPLIVYWDDVLDNGNALNENSVLHFWQSFNYAAAVEKNISFFSSFGWYLDQMHPADATPYTFMDLWKSFYAVNISQGLDAESRGLLLGGGACQWAEWIQQNSLEQHVWPRALAISEVLWSEPENREPTIEVEQRLEWLNCAMKRAGLQTGALGARAPCFGEPRR